MIAAGEVIVKRMTKVGAGLVPTDFTIRNKANLKEYACKLATPSQIQTDCETRMDSLPDNENGYKIGAEVARVAGRGRFIKAEPWASQAVQRVVNILGNPAAKEAGGSMSYPGPKNQSITKNFFTDRDSYVKVGSFAGINIQRTAAGVTATTLAQALQAASGTTPQPQPQPQPPQAPAPQAGATAAAAKAEPEKEEEEKSSITGKVIASVSPSLSSSDKVGMNLSAEVQGIIHDGSKVQVKGQASVSSGRAFTPESTSQHPFGNDASQKPGYGVHGHGAIEADVAVNGTHERTVEIPSVNLVRKNDVARQLEDAMIARWGEKAARLYLDSVVSQHMSRAKDEGKMKEAWRHEVTVGAESFELALLAGRRTGYGRAMAILFKHDLKGIAKLLALITGKEEKEFSNLVDNFVKAKTPTETTAAEDKLEQAFSAITKSEYKMPEKYEEKSHPKDIAFTGIEKLSLGYKDDLAKQRKLILKSYRVTEEELKKFAQDKKVHYPLDDANPPKNPWTAQGDYNTFVAVLKKAEEKVATVHSITAIGHHNIAPPYGEGGLGVRSSLVYEKGNKPEDPTATLKASLGAYVGTGGTELLAADPKIANGKAVAVNAEAEVHFGKSEAEWHRDNTIQVSGGWSDGNKLSENLFMSGALATTVALGGKDPQGRGSDLTFQAAIEAALAIDQEGGPNQWSVVPGATLAYNLGKKTDKKTDKKRPVVSLGYKLQYTSASSDFQSRANILQPEIEGTSDEINEQHSVTLAYQTGAWRFSGGIKYGKNTNRFGTGGESTDTATGKQTSANIGIVVTF